MQKSFHEFKLDMKFKGRNVEVISRCFESPEDIAPEDNFDFPEDIEAIRSGKVGYCCVRVETRIMFEGKVVGSGSDSLGCVTYTDMKDLIQTVEDHDMIGQAFNMAKLDAEETIALMRNFIKEA